MYGVHQVRIQYCIMEEFNAIHIHTMYLYIFRNQVSQVLKKIDSFRCFAADNENQIFREINDVQYERAFSEREDAK